MSSKDIVLSKPCEDSSRSRRRFVPTFSLFPQLSKSLTAVKHASRIFLLSFVPVALGQDTQSLNCSLGTDTFVGNAQAEFKIGSWIDRGICIRAHNVDAVCYATLLDVLNNLNSLRSAEYNGSAGVLSLLPTIGALLGAPTDEIWRLLTIVPFGGGMAMLLSFGGAILPTRLEDYDKSLSTSNSTIGNIFSFRQMKDWSDQRIADQTEKKSNELVERIEKRMQQAKSQRLSESYLWLGLFGMILLLLAAQAAMIIIEQGGVLPWWCVSRWWMHFWYVLVTITAVAENYVQLPFSEEWKLFVSDIPYDIDVEGGDSIHDALTTDEDVETALKQLSTLKAATLLMRRQQQYTRPRNAVLIMVSVVNNANYQRINSFWRLLSKACSIAIFVTGTAFFASVQLLALPMAVMVLVLVLSAGVFGRAIASWIVNGVEKSEPMLHVIANTRAEACKIIASVLTLDKNVKMEGGGRMVQVEIGGNVFVGSRRVATRSSWYVKFLGIMTHPFDLRKVSVVRSMSDESRNSREASGLLPTHERND